MYLFKRIVAAFVNDGLNYPTTYRADGLIVMDQVGGTNQTLYGWNLYNPNGVDVFLKFFNKATPPVLGTDLPALTVPVPSLDSVVLFGSDQMQYFNLGMWVAVTTGYDDLNTSAPVIGLLAQIQYK